METENTKSNGKSGIVQYILTGLLIIAAFYIGVLYTKVTYLEKGGNTTGVAPTQDADTAQKTDAQAITVDVLKKFITEKKQIAFGDTNKKIIFLEVSDPSCPYCQIAAGKNLSLSASAAEGRFKTVAQGGTYIPPVIEMKKLVDSGKASYVWVYMNGHGNGVLGAQALYCAKEQGKFWEAHDLLMSDKGYTILNETVKNDVTKAGQMAEFLKSATNVKTMTECLTNKKYAAQVQADDLLMRETYGISGTPNFFVNDKTFGGAQSFATMQSAVDAALK